MHACRMAGRVALHPPAACTMPLCRAQPRQHTYTSASRAITTDLADRCPRLPSPQGGLSGSRQQVEALLAARSAYPRAALAVQALAGFAAASLKEDRFGVLQLTQVWLPQASQGCTCSVCSFASIDAVCAWLPAISLYFSLLTLPPAHSRAWARCC